MNARKQDDKGMFFIWKLKKGEIRDVYKVQITEQDENFEGKMRENEILEQFSLPSGLNVKNLVDKFELQAK